MTDDPKTEPQEPDLTSVFGEPDDDSDDTVEPLGPDIDTSEPTDTGETEPDADE